MPLSDAEGSKPWYASNTIWANILLTATTLARAVGLIDDDAATAIVLEVPDYITSVVIAVLGIYGIYGRWSATKEVKSGVLVK
jgi:hypothetical protein